MPLTCAAVGEDDASDARHNSDRQSKNRARRPRPITIQTIPRRREKFLLVKFPNVLARVSNVAGPTAFKLATLSQLTRIH